MKFLKTFLCFVLAMALGAPIVAHAKYKVYYQRSSGLYRGRLRTLNNKKVHYVKVPHKYYHVAHTSKVHKIKSERGKKVTFTTRYILPSPGKNGQHWGNPQSIAMTGKKYMYIVYCPTHLRNKGRIVRFNTQMLDEIGVRLHPKELRDAYVKHHNSIRQLKNAFKRPSKWGQFSQLVTVNRWHITGRTRVFICGVTRKRPQECLSAIGVISSTLRRKHYVPITQFGFHYTVTGPMFLVVMT